MCNLVRIIAATMLLLFAPTSEATQALATIHVGEPALHFSLPQIHVEPHAQFDPVLDKNVTLCTYTGDGAESPANGVVLYFSGHELDLSRVKTLHRVQRRFAKQDVQIIALHRGDPQTAKALLRRMFRKTQMVILDDSHAVVSDRYGHDLDDMVMIVDAQGRLFAVGKPEEANLDRELSLELRGLLRGH